MTTKTMVAACLAIVCTVGACFLFFQLTSPKETSKGANELIRPTWTVLVNVPLDEREKFIHSLALFSEKHKLLYEKRDVPFRVRPFIDITMSNAKGDIISVTNLHDHSKFDINGFYETPGVEAHDLKVALVEIMRSSLGNENVIVIK